MVNSIDRHQSTVNDYDDEARKQRLRETSYGYNVRFGRIKRALVKVAFALMPVGAVASAYMHYDVQPEAERLAQTHPEIHQVYAAEDASKRSVAVVDMTGLGTIDATQTAAALHSFENIGNVWALRYDGEGIDTRVVTTMLEREAEEQHVDTLIPFGHSMGGVVAVEVGRHIDDDYKNHKTTVKLGGIGLDCTPVNLDAVRPNERDEGEEMLRWMGRIPGARESRALRFVVEMAARKDNYYTAHGGKYGLPEVDVKKLEASAENVLEDKIFSSDAASNGLIEEQFKAIAASGMQANLAAIARNHTKETEPPIVYMRPRNPADDPVVDADVTQRALENLEKTTDANVRIVMLDGTGHANPRQQPDYYNKALANVAAPSFDHHARDTDAVMLAERHH